MRNEAYALKRGSMEFMKGSFSLLSVVFNHLNGSAQESVQAQKKYLQTMGPALMGGELENGEVITFWRLDKLIARYVIGDLRGELVTEEEAIRRFAADVKEAAGDFEPEECALVACFRKGLSAMEAAAALGIREVSGQR